MSDLDQDPIDVVAHTYGTWVPTAEVTLAGGGPIPKIAYTGAPHAPFACQTELLWFVQAQPTCPVPGAWPFLQSGEPLPAGGLCRAVLHTPEVADCDGQHLLQANRLPLSWIWWMAASIAVSETVPLHLLDQHL